MEIETSCENNFETSETLASFLASTQLLEEAWKVCSIANARFPRSYLVEQIGSVAYVAFSGSQTGSVSEKSGGNLLPLDVADEGGLFAPLYRHSQAEKPIKVHGGMLELFISFYSSLKIQIAALVGRVKSIVITGHSIGGTMASLSALWLLCHLQSTMPSTMSVLCITFGSPLLGNEALHRSIQCQRWSGNFCHVVSKYDIVPRLLFARETVNPVSLIQAIVDGLSSRQLPHDLTTNLFHSVLKDLKLLADAKDPSADQSSFWPFGSYVFCGREGAICVENAVCVIKMMHLMMMTMGSPSCCIEDHLMYGDYVGKVSKQVLKARSFDEDGLPESSFEAGVELALQSSDLTYKDPVQVEDLCLSIQNSSLRRDVAIMAKKCLQMGQNDRRSNLAVANLTIRLSKIVPFRAEIEWYKARCDEADDQLGYYDSFKLKAVPRREGRVNMNRHKLALFWDDVIDRLENNKLPLDFDRRGKWVNTSHSYKLLFEPLDIAEYYRNGTHRQKRHYIEHGREKRYEIFDKWWRNRHVRGREENKRSKFASVTQDSCFWARVEIARECLENMRNESDVTKMKVLWDEIEMFEKYARELIENKEVSKDVLLKNSSFSRWMEEWKGFKAQVHQSPVGVGVAVAVTDLGIKL